MFKNNSALMALKENLEEKIVGKVKFTRQSFGFLELEDNRSFFIPPPLMKKLLPNDLVEVTVKSEDDREFVSSIVSIIKSESMSMTGKVITKEWKGKTSKKFISNDPSYAEMIPFAEDRKEMKDGEWVNVSLTGHPFTDRLFKVNYINSIGNESSNDLPWDYIRTQFRINNPIFALEDSLTLADISYYEDRTHLPYTTIDGERTNDMDDALYAYDDDDYWNLSIAIADPSDLIIDKEQRKIVTDRGYTFYLPDDVVHMIPRTLSEDTYSLKYGEKRPTICLDIKIDKNNGNVISYEFKLAIIKSAAKLSYNYVTKVLEENIILDDVYYKSLLLLSDVTSKLRKVRELTEVIFAEREEYSLVIDNRIPVGVRTNESTISNFIVEEAMLLSNKLFAEFAKKNKLNVLFNTNSGFKLEAKEDIEDIIKDAGIELVNDDLFSLENVVHIQRVIQRNISSSDIGSENLVKFDSLLNRLRRCFCKSEIMDVAEPHKIMGVNAYATWTSPLRKSGDMINHIAIKSFLTGLAQTPINPVEIDSINERLTTSKQAERLLSKILFAKLFKLNPDLIKNGKVINVRKFMTTIELAGSGQYCTLQLRNIKSRDRVFADLDNNALLSGNRRLFKNGDVINIGFESSNLIHQDIEVNLTA